MKDLRIVDGDLVVGGGVPVVTGSSKVWQDVHHALFERYGIDRFHPRWGSILHRFVGRANDARAASNVRAEITRVLQNHIIVQNINIDRMRRDSEVVVNTSEVIGSFRLKQTTTYQDKITVDIVIYLADGSVLSAPITPSSGAL